MTSVLHFCVTSCKHTCLAQECVRVHVDACARVLARMHAQARAYA